MKPALCESGLLKTLLDNLGGKNSTEWHEILRRALRRENPFQDPSITYAIRLTLSLTAGIKTLEELCSQGHIPTKHWNNLDVEPIDNNGNYSNAHRTLTFMLENEQRVEVEVSTSKRELGDVVRGDEGRKWASYTVYVEGRGKMNCLVNHTGNRPWYRWPTHDKPLPGITWRAPTSAEIAAYYAAAAERNEEAFLSVYYGNHGGYIDWSDPHGKVYKDAHWVDVTLQKVAEREHTTA